jgi:hypothetical protein
MFKVKNNLLAIVLILTTLRPGLSISRAVVEEACYIIGQRMHEDNEVGQRASNFVPPSLAHNLSHPAAGDRDTMCKGPDHVGYSRKRSAQAMRRAALPRHDPIPHQGCRIC